MSYVTRNTVGQLSDYQGDRNVFMLREVLAAAGPALRFFGTDKTGLDASGRVSIWAIFETRRQREQFARRFAYRWVVAGDLATYTGYVFDWYDTNGYGLQLASCATVFEMAQMQPGRASGAPLKCGSV